MVTHDTVGNMDIEDLVWMMPDGRAFVFLYRVMCTMAIPVSTTVSAVSLKRSLVVQRFHFSVLLYSVTSIDLPVQDGTSVAALPTNSGVPVNHLIRCDIHDTQGQLLLNFGELTVADGVMISWSFSSDLSPGCKVACTDVTTGVRSELAL